MLNRMNAWLSSDCPPLNLDGEQKRQLKQLALDKRLPVRGLVTQLVLKAIEDNQGKKSQSKKEG